MVQDEKRYWLMIARTGYIVSFVSYVVFLTLDWVRPGFVANVFSPHLFLLSAMVFGILWARHISPRPSSLFPPFFFFIFLLPFSFLLAVFAWVEGRPFGDWRILVTLVAFAVPWIVTHSLRSR